MSPAEKELAELEELAALESAMKKAAPTLAQKAVSEAPGIGGFLAKTGKDAARGLMSGMAGLVGSGGGKTGNIPLDLMSAVTKGAGAQIQKALPVDPNETPNEQLWRKTSEGMGGGALLGGGAGVVPNLFTGGVSGLSGELGRRFGGKAGMGQAGEIAGSALGGGLAGFMSGPRQSVAREDIRRTLPDATPQTFQNASQKLDDFASVGAKTHTLAEAFPENHPLRTLAEEARGGNLANALQARTAGRKEDLQDLGETFLDRIGPQVDPNIVANKAGGAANATLAATKELRSTGVANRLAGETVPAKEVRDIGVSLMLVGRNQARPGAGEAYRTVAKQLLGQDGKPITDVQQLSFAIKELKKNAANPNSPIRAGGAISDVDLGHAISAAEAGLKAASPAFKGAMDDFVDFTRGVIEPQRQGPIGSLSDRNPLIAGQTPVSKLEGVLKGNSPQTISSVARTLDDPNLTQGQTVSPTEIARALAQQRLQSGPTNPGEAMRGNPGSQQEDQFSALLRAGGNNLSNTLKPLAVADELQGMQGLPNRNEGPQMRGWQAVIRPFRTLDMMLSGQAQRSVQKELAELLADPAKLAELQKAAMFDPNLRRQLSSVGAMLPVINQEGN